MPIVIEGGVRRTLRGTGLLLNNISKFDATVATQGSEQANAQRWLGGVQFQPRPCRGLQILYMLPCDTGVQLFDPSGTDCQAYVTQMPFQIVDTLIGSPLQLTETDLDNLLTERADQMLSWAFAKALIGPIVTPNTITLASVAHAPVGTPFTSGALPINRAIAVLENELGRSLFGAQGIIHMSPGMLHLAQSGGGLDECDPSEMADSMMEGPCWITANGTVVISDAGYVDALKPQASAASDQTLGTDEWIYASGPVVYQHHDAGFIGGEIDSQSMDIRLNKIRRWRDQMGILLFDPCPVTAVLASYA